MFDRDLHKKLKISIKDFFSKCDQSRLLKKSLTKNLTFCAVRLLKQIAASNLRVLGKIMIIPHGY